MERRVKDRIETDVQLTCRAPARPTRAIMHDVSNTGCRMELPEAAVELGGTVLIDLPGSAQVAGCIVWVRGCQAGVRFERALRGAPAVALGLPEEPVEPVQATRRRGLVASSLSRVTDNRY